MSFRESPNREVFLDAYYVHDGWPPHLIAAWLNLSPDQIQAALAYIETHRAGVEAQYQQVLRQAEESRAYWEGRNWERLKRCVLRLVEIALDLDNYPVALAAYISPFTNDTN